MTTTPWDAENPSYCDTFWGSHGCSLTAGHEEPCLCESCHNLVVNTDEHALCVGCAPYYGPRTAFYSNHGTPTPPQTLAARGERV